MKYQKDTDKLFDESNFEPIVIEDNEGNDIKFDQVAVVELEGQGCFAILSPITKIEGVGEDEALVFFIDEENDQLVYIEDEAIVCEVFNEYNEMLEDEE